MDGMKPDLHYQVKVRRPHDMNEAVLDCKCHKEERVQADASIAGQQNRSFQEQHRANASESKRVCNQPGAHYVNYQHQIPGLERNNCLQWCIAAEIGLPDCEQAVNTILKVPIWCSAASDFPCFKLISFFNSLSGFRETAFPVRQKPLPKN